MKKEIQEVIAIQNSCNNLAAALLSVLEFALQVKVSINPNEAITLLRTISATAGAAIFSIDIDVMDVSDAFPKAGKLINLMLDQQEGKEITMPEFEISNLNNEEQTEKGTQVILGYVKTIKNLITVVQYALDEDIYFNPLTVLLLLHHLHSLIFKGCYSSDFRLESDMENEFVASYDRCIDLIDGLLEKFGNQNNIQ